MGRPKYLAWLHSIGTVLSIGALIIGGLHNPAIGFPIVIAILIALEIPSSPKPTNKEILRMIYGSIRRGGIRRGIFIREMFAGAVIYSAISNFASGATTASLSNMLLAAALIISSIASEIEVHTIRKAMK
ncbi:hypothetical protein ACFLTZ_04480 [Chloroflexota bacterium]